MKPDTKAGESRPPQQFSPADAVTHTFFVYEADTGNLVHGHREVVLPYGDAPGKEEIMKRALDLAVEVTRRDPQGLRAIEVSEDELIPGTAYKVDLKSQRLVRLEASGARSQ